MTTEPPDLKPPQTAAADPGPSDPGSTGGARARDRRAEPPRAAVLNRRVVHACLAVLTLTALGATLAKGLHSSTAGGGTLQAGPPTRIRSNAPPALAGPTLDGGRFDLVTVRGRPVLVNVWASWCDPCRTELPLLARARQRWAAQGLAIVTIDVRDNAEAARDLLTQLAITDLPVIVDRTGELAVSWGIRGVPETFLIDRTGVVRQWAQGAVTPAWLEQRIPPLVAP